MDLLDIKKRKVIIDTDIGTDIDDALAIYLALKSPEIDIIGITTVFQDTMKRAKIAAKLLRLAGRSEIPVVPGRGRPIINKKVYNKIIDFDESPKQYMKDMEIEKVSEGLDAVDFIINEVLSSDEPITIIPIGAMTNIALSILKEPKITNNIEQIVMMGGAYMNNFVEYNIACDPEAASIIFSSDVDILAVGLDVTLKCKLSEEDISSMARLGQPATNMLIELIDIWGTDVYLHDPLAIAAVINNSFVKKKIGRIHVELGGEYSRGMTIDLSNFNWGYGTDASKVEICTDVDFDSFIEFYMNRVLS